MVKNQEYIGPDLEGLWGIKPNPQSKPHRWHIGPRSVCRLYSISGHPDDLPNAPIKIGVSFHPEARLAEMQAHSPVRLVLLSVRRGGREAERRYHHQFAADRLHGEWFKRSEPLMEVIRGG